MFETTDEAARAVLDGRVHAYAGVARALARSGIDRQPADGTRRRFNFALTGRIMPQRPPAIEGALR